MQRVRSRPRTRVAAQARYALSTPPLKATIRESKPARRSKRRRSSGALFRSPRRGSLVKILFFVEGVLIVELVLVFVFAEILVVFVLEVLVFLLLLLVVIVGDFDFVGAHEHEVLAALGATEGVAL